MRNIVQKTQTLRTAVAEGYLRVAPATLDAIRENRAPKGDPFPVARIAAIQAAKETPRLIPFCHLISLEAADIDFAIEGGRIRITASVTAIYKTGVEMEALAAVSVAALNLYDMLKAIDDEMVIENVRLLEKRGGKSDFAVVDKGLEAVVVVVSDSVSAGGAEDKSGRAIAEALKGMEIASEIRVVPDELPAIVAEVERATAGLVILTGGTGLGPRDVTPEAVLPLLDKRLPGVEEAIRAFGQQRTPYAMLSRTVAGLRGGSVVLCLPGSPSGVADAMRAVFPALLHVFDVLAGAKHD